MYLPLEKGMGLSNKFPSPNDGLCQFSLYKIGSVVLEYIYLILSMYFHYFVIISP